MTSTRSRPLNLTLALVFLSGSATFMALPLVSLGLRQRGLSGAEVGLILGIFTGTGQLVSFLLGPLLARWRLPRSSAGAFVLRAAGVGAFATTSNVVVLGVAAAVASIGGTSASLAIKTALFAANSSSRVAVRRSIAINSAAVVGPALGAIVYAATGFGFVLTVVWLAYLASALGCLLLLPDVPVADRAAAPGRLPPGSSVAPLLLVFAATFAYWVAYAQWNVLMPVFALGATGNRSAASLAFAANAVIVIIAQALLVSRLLVRFPARAVLSAGLLTMAVAFLLFLPAPGLGAFIAFLVLFSLAESMTSPSLDLATRDGANAIALATAFGFASTVAGLGSLVGSSVGGSLYTVHHALVAAVVVTVCVGGALAIRVGLAGSGRVDPGRGTA
jgi:predicted MFS family arabinose efflux permease